VAVYDRNGWNAEPFHFLMSAESVYSEFAAVEATITVPGNYIIATSGEAVEGDPGWQAVTVDTSMQGEKLIAWQDSVRQQLRQSEPRKVRFQAKPARNFIWSVSPAFVRSTAAALSPVNVFYRGAEQQAFAKKFCRKSMACCATCKRMSGRIHCRGSISLPPARAKPASRR
jgi:hypothetical protein